MLLKYLLCLCYLSVKKSAGLIGMNYNFALSSLVICYLSVKKSAILIGVNYNFALRLMALVHIISNVIINLNLRHILL